ncbi:MAG: Gfo/Idh/MocA family oxidoreductase [Thermofilaceae archaeon]
MKVGVIGCGSIGKVHIKNLKAVGAEVVAACDIDEEELKYVRANFGIDNLYQGLPRFNCAQRHRCRRCCYAELPAPQDDD